MAKDPVCGMDVTEREAHNKKYHEGKTYYFCSEKCQQEFEREPSKYATKPEKKFGT